MRTESGNVEGHAALLKLHRGAHMGRTGQGGARTKIVHSHPTQLRAQPVSKGSSTQSTPRTQPTARCTNKQTQQIAARPSVVRSPDARPSVVRSPDARPSVVRSPELNCRRRSSCTSTGIWYPGSQNKRLSSDCTASSKDSARLSEINKTQDNVSDDEVTEKAEGIPKSVTGSHKRSLGYGYRRPSESLFPTTAKEFDFDLDEADEKEKEEAAKDESVKALQADSYNRMCKLEGITPCGRFKRQITDCVADVSNSLLGTKDVKSICVSLTSNITIKELDLSGNDLSEKGARYVAEALRENTSVEDLSLCQCNIDLQGLQSLADVFLEMKPMTRIDLSRNNFERKHAEVISEVIKKNDYIEEIVLSGNKFDDISGVSIGKALGSNVGIKKLDLSWNHLRREGASAVCMALKFNQTLEELDLSWNGLAEEGCRALGVALPCNHTLKELDLSCNRINIFCLTELLKGLERNDTLKILRMDQNPMTTDGAIGLIKCLQKSQVSQLTDLYITDIPINTDFLDELDELLKIRQVRVYHRDPNKKKITPIIRERTLNDYDPAMILFEYMKQENLRLIDLFRTFDTDSSQTVSKDELKEGFLTINMPLNEEALDSLFERLDLNDNDEIEYEEVKSGYRKTISKTRRNDDNQHQAAALAGLKKLVRSALEEKRKTMRSDATKKVLARRQSLRAVFQIRK